MTVKELKEKLELFPDDAVIYLPDYDYGAEVRIIPADYVGDDLPTETDSLNSVLIM